MSFVAFACNETDPDLPTGQLAYHSEDPETCKRIKSFSGAVLVEVVIDKAAYRKCSKEKTSWLKLPNGKWMGVSAGSAYIFMYGRYDMEIVTQLLNYD